MMTEQATFREHLPVVFISLGPGNSSRLTLEAYDILHTVDRIFCFGTLSDGQYNSYARDTVLAADKELESFVEVICLPMQSNRTDAVKVYDDLAERIASEWKDGKNVGVCVEGSSSVYASVRTVMDLLDRRNIHRMELPGVPSFIAAAALAGISLCDRNERLLIVPGNMIATEITQWLSEGCNIVIMKLSRCVDEVRRAVKEHEADCEVHYFEYISCGNQVHLDNPERILAVESFPYFSQMIIKPKRK
ncbi:MAG: precorrin-2 C(20)-methyltransferase [Phocaeicola sp.]|uniref:precorrin-2 C(20)-methyltransferase n=1 Tax=Phocaeicola TaxID=909656 RepID=UPI00234F151F|nr:precorrin-2 C(20)-methyltransferase [Phocaeicola oris]MCE2615767.1 precorrin-2 C(20)-methyltransferase [Phocaeicola oris]